jgi:hypothetical protein
VVSHAEELAWSIREIDEDAYGYRPIDLQAWQQLRGRIKLMDAVCHAACDIAYATDFDKDADERRTYALWDSVDALTGQS